MQFSQSALAPAERTADRPQLAGSRFLKWLQDNLGAYVQIEFLIGTQGMTGVWRPFVTPSGQRLVVLHDVGNEKAIRN